MATKFFKCATCGNVVVKVVDSGITPFCCGAEMTEIVPGMTDGSMEKHLPVVEYLKDGSFKVRIGSQPHPMGQDHHICFIYLETEKGGHLKYLDLDKPAEAVFTCCQDETPTAIYAYCNVHGLWKTELHANVNSTDKACIFSKKCK